MDRTPVWAPAVITTALAAITVLIVEFAGRPADYTAGFPLDDAWIYMVYGRSLAESGLLAYNEGVAATGCTGPAWAVVVALSHLLSGSLSGTIALVKLAGSLFFIGSAAATSLIVQQITEDRLAALLGGAIAALSTTMSQAALSGMEVTLAGFLSLSAVGCLLKKWHWGAGVLMAVALLTRPEAALLTIMLAGAAMLLAEDLQKRMSAGIALLLPSLILGIGWLTLNYASSGRPLPATFYMKGQSSLLALPGRMTMVVWEIYSIVPPFFGLIGFASLAGYFAPNADRRLMILPLAALTLFLASAVVTAPSDPGAFYFIRYYLPAVSLGILATVIGAWQAGAWLQARHHWLPLGLLAAWGFVGAIVTAWPLSVRLHNDTRNINEVQRFLGVWLKERISENDALATVDAGAVRYFSDRFTVDLIGLNTPELHWSPDQFREEHPVRAIVVMPALFTVESEADLTAAAGALTENYTVMSAEQLATQVIVVNTSAAPSSATVSLRNWRLPTVILEPWERENQER